MTIKKYHIETGTSINSYDFGENILDFGTGDYGIEVSFRGCSMIDEDISEALEENDEFIRAAKEEGYDTSFNEMSAFEVYLKLTRRQYSDDIIIDDLGGLFESATSGYYSNLDSQVSKVRNYIEDNDDIKVIEEDGYDEFDVDYIVEFDDSMFDAVKEFLEKSDKETAAKNEEPSSFEYVEEYFKVPMCKVTFKNVPSLELTIKEI